MKTKLFIGLMFIGLMSCTTAKIAPEIKESVQRKIESKDFTVTFNQAIPTRMKPVYLTSEYTLTISGDSATVFLPYYGVAYSAPYNSGEGGIKYQKNPVIDYKITPRNKGGWDINFQLQSAYYHDKFFLTIFENGKSYLQVNSNERDGISFNGDMK